jgi:hypothetical protein
MIAPSWLIGIEADGEIANITGSFTGCSDTGCSTSNTKVDDFGTVRGRLGYVWNNVLLYGTGGWAWSHSETDRTIICVVAGGGVCPGGPSPSSLTGRTASASGTQSGWVAGARAGREQARDSAPAHAERMGGLYGRYSESVFEKW